MRNKIFFQLCLAAGVVCVASCTNGESDADRLTVVSPYGAENSSLYSDQYMSSEESQAFVMQPDVAAKVFNKRIPPLNSVIVCRDKQCAPAELSMSREYIYNSLAHLTDNNLDATALLCEANAQAHVCVNPYLTVPARIGVTPAYVFFDGVKIIDASSVKGNTALNLVLGYNLSYNGQTPSVCKPDKAMLYVKGNNEIVLNGNGFKCDMTSVGTTTVRVMFTVDYIDLDYGYIGGYYSIGLSGPANGGGYGYGMIRLPKDAHPLSPELSAVEDEEDLGEPEKTPVKPQVKEERLNADETPRRQKLDLGDDESSESLAPVEVIEEGGAKKPESKKQNFSANDSHERVHLARPSDDAESKNEPYVYDVSGEGNFGAEFEEVYVDDIDDYVK
ncbi:MAG: hypothetical protein J6C85_01735 [Alphaproteobacteria bacterium]|nr:hypothetical protein [Alphaproteobacteria bacterium]